MGLGNSVTHNCNMAQWASHIHGAVQVPATLLWPGVWCCEAPAHAIGMVDLCLTDRHGRRCSQNTLFMYRSAPSDQSDKPRSVTGGIAVLALKLRKATAGVAFVGLFLERCSEETGEQADPSSLTDFQVGAGMYVGQEVQVTFIIQHLHVSLQLYNDSFAVCTLGPGLRCAVDRHT